MEVHELFRAQAARTPEAPAVVGAETWSYAELNRRSDLLARCLRSLGAGPDVPIGVCLERSPELIGALVAVLKAGGVFLPLDLSYPSERLAAMLDDAAPALVLTRRALRDRLPAHRSRTVLLDDVPSAGAADGLPRPELRGHHLSYLIYTSGSTGRPKGVALPHSTLAGLIGWQVARPAFAARTAQFTTASFDVFLQEVFSTLCSGGALVLLSEDERRDPSRLAEVLESRRVERLFLPFVALQQLAEVSAAAPPSSLREVITAGEALQVSDAVRRFFTATGATLENQYGPSESHVVTAHPLSGASSAWPALPPIGRAVAGFRVDVLDRGLHPVPAGTAGELCLAGDGLARGYLGRPGQTAERFVPDPGGTSGGRLYRTGDLGRFLEDGAIEFLGRIDHQVKIRGFRVEPGEVEVLLSSHPAVREVAVVARGEGVAKRLAAYWVTAPGAGKPSAESLCRFLDEKLPPYMVPTAWTELEALPLTPSGKVDRRSLPEPEVSGTAPFTAPRTPSEETVAAVWAEVLGVERAGTEDDFFDLGGHSLLAGRAVVRLRAAFGVELEVRDLFAAPSVAAMAALLESRRGGTEAAGDEPIVPVPRTGDGLPLSYSQESLWFLDRLQPGLPVYNVAVFFELEGELSPPALEAALSALVERHEVLRTRFVAGTGGPVQVVDPPGNLPLPWIDLTALPEAAVERLGALEARRPFDLTRGPLLRAVLLRATPRRHLLLVGVHHVVADGWSLDVMAAELAALYPAALHGRPAPAPPSVQFGDFASWQRRHLTREKLEDLLADAGRRLAGAPTVLELPTDRPRPAVPSYRGARRSAVFPGHLRESLHRRHGQATPFMTAAAAFAVLLGRSTGQRDLLLGAPAANRDRPEVADLVGHFVETLVLRFRLASHSFDTLLREARREVLAAHAHQELPFEKLVEALAPQREVARNPLVQATLDWQQPVEPPGAEPRFRFREIHAGVSKFDLHLLLTDDGESLTVSLEYSTDLFDATTISRLEAQFKTLLEGAAAAPERSVWDLPLLPAAERQCLLYEWSVAPHVRGPDDLPISELLAAQAARTPDAPALHTREETVSYRRLDARANALAHALRTRGIRAGAVVAVAVERVADAVPALLGILKAGATYLPLDLGLPQERLDFMMDDTGARALVVRGARGLALAAAGGRPVLELDDGERDDAPAPASPLYPAYVIFTSGTTGRPKGVVLCHRHVVPLLSWSLGYFGFGAHTRVLQTLSHTFDFGFMEVMTTLLAGGCLYCPENDERLDPSRLADLVEEHRLNTVHATPSFFREIAALGRALPSLGVVHLGGEAVSRTLLREIAAVTGPGCRVYNGYGPTETSINCAILRLEGRPLDGGFPGVAAPIGRVTARSSLYVLDRRAWLAGAGIPGELVIGGAGVALGYLGRPALTAERFVPDPFGADPGRRLYRSGDLVRTLPDGRIEFLGRIDHQVKVRGFRVELGEIEAALAGHPALRQVVVVARGVGLKKRLVAYVVLAAGEPSAGELRRFLSDRLPAYMVPSAFVILTELPLTASGKVDHRALPEPDARSAEEEQVAPRGPLEELVAQVWVELLSFERVGAHDDFFELGGHSLLAVAAVARLRQACGVELDVRDLFAAPTAARMAALVTSRRDSVIPAAPPILPVDRSASLPLSFPQEYLWVLDRLMGGLPAYNIPLVYEIEDDLRPAALGAALGALVRRHETLRTRFAADGDEPRQLVAAPGDVPLALADLSSLPLPRRQTAARRLADAEARRPFDLERGPVLRATLLRLAPRCHRLLLTLHHIAADGASMPILDRELAALYAGAELPPLNLQYADFAVWQRRRLSGETLTALVAGTRARLEGAPQVLDLPTDRPRPRRPSFAGGLQESAADAGLRDALVRRPPGTTAFMTAAAALAVLLARFSGQRDLLLGVPAANRGQLEVEGLIGFFVNILVLRFAVSGSFAELLHRTRRETLDAFAHQELPFEKLVEALTPERDPSRNPLFQVLLVWETAAPEPWPRQALHSGTSKLDLTLFLHDDGEGLGASLEHSTALFDTTTARRLLRSFRVLLAAALDNAERPVEALPLLSPEESWQLLVAWNDSPRLGTDSRLLHQLFEEQARRTPGAVAVVHGDERLTYAELDERATALAVHLRGLGVGPEVLVGVLARRTPALVAGLLAILKAGGAYVPLDPTYPAERLAFLLEDADLSVLLAHRDLLGRLPAHQARIVDLDEPRGPAGAWRSVPVSAENLAYLIYTSGSTGRPKAVAIAHRSAEALLRWARGVFGDAELAGVLAATSLTFDLSAFELFVPLAWGGRVILADNALALPGLAAAGEVTLVNTVPSAMAELDRLDAVPGSVLTVNLAGEPLPGALAERVYRRPHVRRLLNLYGPSEDTTYSTFVQVPRRGRREPTIGRPVAGSQAYVLDRRLAAAPVGVPGELYLGGAGLARGYLGRPALTAERFVPDAFAGSPGARLYRTGDLVRLLAGGELEFLGRLDHQVKIRGFRIELGEIEALLARHPTLREVVVVARVLPGAAGTDRELVAYVAAETGQAADAAWIDTLRAFLGAELPAYMVPAVFVPLDALPRTPNGKVDRAALGRKALPEPRPRRADEATFTAPSGVVEEELAGIWAAVLGVDRVGRDDDFFALGGHSLKATRVLARLRAARGVDLPLRVFFEAPTLAGLAAVLGESGDAMPAVERLPRGGDFPLSFAQERMWLLERFEPGTALYNLPACYDLRGPLDVSALRGALAALVERHEVLRTTFTEAPRQRVAARWKAPLPCVDLTSRPDAAAEALAAEARRPFDLAHGPLLRATLVRLGEREHRLLVVFHHIVVDGTSLEIFEDDLGKLYRGESPAALPVQYADFAAWQRRFLTGETLDAQLGYWRRQLAGAPAVLELPTDRPRSTGRSRRGALVSRDLSGELGERLTALAAREGASRFMALLAVTAALLSRLSGTTDVVVGSPVAGRARPELEGLIGLFVNSLVLRCDLRADPDFRTLLCRVRDTALDAFSHQDVPFERLVEELVEERDLAHNPLFQVVLLTEEEGSGHLGPDLSWRRLVVGTETAKFDLTFHLLDAGPRLAATAEYSADLFDATTAARWLAHFGRLLEAVAGDPGVRLSELPLLDPAARHQVLAEWRQGPASALPACGLDVLFAAQADRCPDAEALVWNGGAWTYAELADRSAVLARRLRRLGVGREAPVAVAVERSPELVATFLAVIRAGGFYVPLALDDPPERVALLLEDLGVEVMVTRRATHRRWASLPAGLRVLLLDDAEDAVEPESLPAADPGQLAYVLYTSGSTGTPKGVAVAHRAVVRLALRPDFLHVARGETFLMAAPVSFDASTLEIWMPLLHGARLALLPPGPASLEELAAAVEELGVTTLWLTAGLFHPMVESRLPSLRGLRHLLAGGDVLSPAHCRRVVVEAPGTVMINGYGPTENTTFTTCHRMSRPEDVSDPVPVGRPIAHTTVFVVDRRLRTVPPGVVGELLTGGAGLARGYARRPGLTAAAFVPDPFGGSPGGRLYRTGDLARWLADGRVELLGRRDHQVKIRGFRIELGEIEAALAEHPGIREVAVVARGEGTGPASDKRLVAYVVPSDGEPDTAALRRFLGGRLPGYMIPSAFVTLAGLPLTSSGKVDRRSLPEPDWRGAAEEYVAPRGPLEEVVAQVWSEALDVGRVGAHDSFFELGGHSLLATRVISRLRQELDVEVPLRRFFEAPTVSGLARALVAARRSTPPAPIERSRRSGRIPLSSSQERLWFLDQLAPGDPSFNIPEALRLTGAGLDVAALGRALGEVVRRHEVLRTGFGVFEGAPHQVVAPRLTLDLPIVDLSRLAPLVRGREAERQFAAMGRHAFDLARAPLLRLHLLVLDDDEHVLAVVLHHTIGDGASLEVLFGELTALYEAFAADAGAPSPLPEPPIQYADFALWQRGRLSGGALADQLAYWRAQLAGAPPVLELPGDRPRRGAGPRHGAVARSVLPADLVGEVRRVVRSEGSTLFMFLLAAFDVLLCRYTGESDLVVGSPVAQREHPETEGLIGFFVNTVALRVRLDGDPAFRELLGRVRRTAFDAYAHAELPFDVVAGEVRGERASDTMPVFQVMLSLVDVDAGPRPFGTLKRQLLDIHNGTAQLEWSLIVLVAGEELQVVLEYDRTRFEPRTAERALQDFRRVVAAAAADPETRLSGLLPDVGRPQPAESAVPPPAPVDRGARSEGRRERRRERRAGLSEEKRALLAERLKGRGGAAPSSPRPVSLVAIDPAGSRPPFFCVHPAGGDVLCFQPLARQLGAEQPFYGLQSRGLTAGHEPHRLIADMARDYVAEVRTAVPKGPYRLGGWSFGGLVAFEMAQELRRQGEDVSLLAILDTLPRLAAEDAPDEAARGDDARWLMHVAEYAEGLWGEPLGLTYEELRGMEDEPRLVFFLERLRRSGILPQGAGVAELRRLLTVFKANAQAAFDYEPRLYPGRVTLFRAAENTDLDALSDPTLGWGEVATEPVAVHTVPGDHITLLAAPNVQHLAARLNICLEEA